MNTSEKNLSHSQQPRKTNQNIQVYVRCRPLNNRERSIRSAEIVDVISPKELVVRHTLESKLTKKFTFDRTFGQDSKQVEVYNSVVAPLIEEVLSGYNCTVFAYGQTGTGKTHTMVGTECAELKASWEDDSDIGIIPRALCHLFDELRMRKLEFSMRISYLELYNEELCDLLSSDDTTKIRIYDDSTKKGSVIIQGLEEIPVHSKDDVYKLLEKGKERRRTATTLMNAQSSRSHTVFSILVHIKENGNDGEEMLKIGKLNLVDLAGSENVSKAGNEKGIRVRETVNINQSLLTLGRVITALVERTPHIPYRESKLTRLLQESLGGRTKTSIIATISPGHKDIEETLSTLEYAHRAKNIQNKPEVNQKLTKRTVLKEYTEEIDKLKRDLMAARDKNGIYLAEETYNEMTMKMDSQNRELNEKVLLLKALKDELSSKDRLFNEVSLNLVEKTEELNKTDRNLKKTTGTLLETKKVLTHTKRRYKEKKVLLESHVKTEEKLKSQATQIMEVAEIATQDTVALHGTIERRKDVDVKIQTACEQFSERMHDNFESMDENLKELQTKQQNDYQQIQKELGNCSAFNTELLENLNNQVKNIHNLLENHLTKSLCQEDAFKNILKNLNDEHQVAIIKLLDELKEKENHFKQQIKENLTSLESFNEKQQSSLDNMREQIKQQLIANHRELQQQTNEIRQGFDSIKQTSLDNIKDLKQISKELEEEQSHIDEEKRILEEFQQKMLQLRQKRTKCLENKCAKVKKVDSSQLALIGKATDTSLSIQQFENKTTTDLKTHCTLLENLTSDMELGIDQSVAKCSTLNIQLDNMSSECLKQSHQISETQSQYHNSLNEKSQLYYHDKKRLCLENVELLKTETQNISSSVEGETKLMKKHLDMVKSFNGSMQTSLRDYTQVYKKQMTTCSNDVDSFRKSELKTYTATGSTPSKREFSYPRVLATTSPHTKIVKRFRQENEWSDLDTTVPIDEESENECGVISINNVSDAETILNSTPIDVDALPEKRSSTSSNSGNPNQLKVPLQNGRSNSLSRYSPNKRSPNNSPRANSPYSKSPCTSTPASLKENKENME